MANDDADLSRYKEETDAKERGNIFEQLVARALERRYGRSIDEGTMVVERNLGSGTVFDVLTTADGTPLIIEIKHRNSLISLSDGTSSRQLPSQVEMALSNAGTYEIVVPPHTRIGDRLRIELSELQRQENLKWRISAFDPATAEFTVLYGTP